MLRPELSTLMPCINYCTCSPLLLNDIMMLSTTLALCEGNALVTYGFCYNTVWYKTALLNSLRPSDAYMGQETFHPRFRKWLVAWSAPSHYLNQCWNIVNLTLWNKLQWNFNRNSNIFILENGFECVVCEMAAILSRPQCVKALRWQMWEASQTPRHHPIHWNAA